MLFSATAALMLSSVCSAAVLPREEKPASYSDNNSKFIIHSKAKGADNFDNSLGYMFNEYAYGGGYYATLHKEKSDAISGSLDNTSLNFGDEYTQGLILYEMSEQYPSSIAQIFSGQEGTAGMAVEDGLLKWNAPDGVPVSWFACENWALRWGPATAIFTKWENSTTTEGCVDVDLVVEYV